MRLLALLCALALAGLLTACGGTDEETLPRASGTGADRAFAQAMVPHHESAIAMAKIAERRAESRTVRELATEITRAQTAELVALQRLDRRLDVAGMETGDLGVPHHMTGMDGDPGDLRTAESFDRAFAEMMIPHHEGAITMARAELAKGEDEELRDLARRIVTAQEREIRTLRQVLAGDAGGGGGAVVPDGGQAAGHGGG